MLYITFNSDYVLKPDDGRVLIQARLPGRNLLKGVEDSFTNIIHPIYAMILSCVNGRSYDECISDASHAVGVEEKLTGRFVRTLLNNPNQVVYKGKDGTSVFPPYTLVSCPERRMSQRYTPDLFDYTEVDLRVKRHLTPSSITLMFNNICVTNCIYCYQDKSRKVNCSIPLPRIMDLIHESYNLHVSTFDVVGGEFFLYKHWRKVLSELIKYGYQPFLSTKIPLKEKDIAYLSELGVHDIQLSIDTMIESHLIASIKVAEGYVCEMCRTIRLLDKYGIPVTVHTVLTQYNDTKEDMKSIYNVLREVEHLLYWHVVKGDPTLYPRTPYENIEISPSALDAIIDYLSILSKTTAIPIHCPGKATVNTINENSSSALTDDRLSEFFHRTYCSGLFSALYILPDGQVTICEQLYWNKRFIVGDVMRSSLQEIWNSEKSKSLYYIRQEDIPIDSPCHSCMWFERCRSDRQVCYREIIKKYGKERWYYPDVLCPLGISQ